MKNITFLFDYAKRFCSARTIVCARGVSFFEVMVTVAIISFGFSMIYKAFFISLDYVDHLTHRLQVITLLENKIREVEEHFKEDPETALTQYENEEEPVKFYNKEVLFKYIFNIQKVDDLSNLYLLDLTVSWLEGRRNVSLSRAAYIFSNEKKKAP